MLVQVNRGPVLIPCSGRELSPYEGEEPPLSSQETTIKADYFLNKQEATWSCTCILATTLRVKENGYKGSAPKP